MKERPNSNNKRQDALIARALARAVGGGGAAANPALTQAVWFQDYVAGLDSNPGTALAPVRTAAEIKRRWQGGIAGTRPVLPVSQTINMVSPAPDFSDPLLVLADVDLMAGARILVQPAAPTIKRSGHVTAITNPFARTSTGRLALTDAGVADWTSDHDQLFIDTTQNAASWVTAGVSPANLSAVRPVVNPAAPPFTGIGATVTVAPADAYSIVTPLSVYFGTSSRTRWVPNGGASAAARSTFTFSRLRGLSQGFSDPLHPETDGMQLDGATVFFEECRIDQPIFSFAVAGNVFANCSFQSSLVLQGKTADPGFGNLFLLAGYTSGGFVNVLGGVLLDQDFSSLGTTIQCVAGLAPNALGRVSVYAAAPALAIGDFGLITMLSFEAPLLYGTTGGGPIFDVGRAASFVYVGTAVLTFVFDSVTFTLDGQGNGWGFNRVTGLVGPTPLTLAHQDAALGVGTGFGGSSQDPASGARFLNN